MYTDDIRMSKVTPVPSVEKIAHSLCIKDFFEKYASACSAAEGNIIPWDDLKKLTVEEFANAYAQNGIRVTFDRSYHMCNYANEANTIRTLLNDYLHTM